MKSPSTTAQLTYIKYKEKKDILYQGRKVQEQ